jgi:hypothetical protein
MGLRTLPREVTVDVTQLMEEKPSEILTDAVETLKRAILEDYENDGLERARPRLGTLLNVAAECIQRSDTGPISSRGRQLDRTKQRPIMKQAISIRQTRGKET